MIEYRNIKELTGIDNEESLLNFADIEEAIRLGLAKPYEVIKGKGLSAAIEEDGTYIISAADDESTIELLDHLPMERVNVICVHGQEAIDYAKSSLHFEGTDTYYQFVYPLSAEDISKHMHCMEGYTLDVSHPRDEDFPLVLANYDLIPEEDLIRDFKNKAFIAGYTDNELACFKGLHREGAMGLLRVFPRYRRRGYAEKLYSTLIHNQILSGALPYCHVDVTNDASIALQNKLGFVKANQKVAWLGKEIKSH